MDAYDCIRSRREVREYRPDPVPDEIVRKILQAGRWAPSSKNEQPWHFIVVRDRDTLRAIGEVATSEPFIADAPMAIAVATENAFRRDLDAGRALQQMQLMAWSEGIGSCFVGLTLEGPDRKVKELRSPPTAARATFALNSAEWLRRGRLLISRSCLREHYHALNQAAIPLIPLFRFPEPLLTASVTPEVKLPAFPIVPKTSKGAPSSSRETVT